MGAIEKAMRNSKNKTTPFIFEPVLGMVFDSRAEAYSWEVGFGIRYGTSARNRSEHGHEVNVTVAVGSAS
jgi:hypothetical protein